MLYSNDHSSMYTYTQEGSGHLQEPSLFACGDSLAEGLRQRVGFGSHGQRLSPGGYIKARRPASSTHLTTVDRLFTTINVQASLHNIHFTHADPWLQSLQAIGHLPAKASDNWAARQWVIAKNSNCKKVIAEVAMILTQAPLSS